MRECCRVENSMARNESERCEAAREQSLLPAAASTDLDSAHTCVCSLKDLRFSAFVRTR